MVFTFLMLTLLFASHTQFRASSCRSVTLGTLEVGKITNFTAGSYFPVEAITITRFRRFKWSASVEVYSATCHLKYTCHTAPDATGLNQTGPLAHTRAFFARWVDQLIVGTVLRKSKGSLVVARTTLGNYFLCYRFSAGNSLLHENVTICTQAVRKIRVECEVTISQMQIDTFMATWSTPSLHPEKG